MISKEKKIIFLLPPKTGSTSLKRCIMEAGVHFSTPTKQVDYPVYHSTLTEIMEAYNVREDELGDYKIIQIVRNPFDRFISAWKHQTEIVSRFTNTPHYTISLSEMIDKVKNHKHLLPNNIDDFYIQFYGDLSFKTNSFKNGTWGGMRFWCDQIWWNNITNTTNYFKLEDIKKDTTELSDYIGLKLPKLPHIKPNMHSKRDSDYRAYYTDGDMESVNKLFNNDITTLNYEF